MTVSLTRAETFTRLQKTMTVLRAVASWIVDLEKECPESLNDYRYFFRWDVETSCSV